MKNIKTDIMNFVNENHPNGKCDYFENWANARGSYIEAFIEYLEVFNKVDYNTIKEKEIIETYRCLSVEGKGELFMFLSKLHQRECNERAKEKFSKIGS